MRFRQPQPELVRPGSPDWLAAARAGDPRGWDALVAWAQPILRQAATAEVGEHLGRHLTISDVVQSATVQVLQSIPSFRGATRGALRAWLVSIVRHLVMLRHRHYTARRRTAPEAIAIPAARAPSPLPPPPQTAAARDEWQHVQAALDRLPPQYGQALRWHADPRHTHHRSAARTGRSPGASRVLLTRARAALRIELLRNPAGRAAPARRRGPD